MAMGRSAQLAGRPDLSEFQEEQAMHDNPRANEEEQELAQTGRMDEEEEQRSGYAPPDAADEDESEE
jgi:hypothetical protein